jgi:methylated-DNA-protein-cysteine methyltransferase-like protein
MGSDYFDRVYEVVRRIPTGRVSTYGAIAEFLGSVSAARTVGYAMNASHSRPDVPAHRVVNRIGLLTGKHHFGGTHMMEELLRSEGVEVEDDRIVGFAQHFWDPSVHLPREFPPTEGRSL